MNAQDLIDEAFGQLDDSRLAALARKEADDPGFARICQEFRRVLPLLIDDGQDIEPPADLASRTLCFIREQQEPQRAIIEMGPAATRFRWADLAVAATILLASLIGLVPALRNSQITASNLGCLANLNQIGRALSQYALVYNQFPFVPTHSPGAYVGSYRVLLHEPGFAPDPSIFNCPCNGCDDYSKTIPKFGELCDHESRQKGALHDQMVCDYAYSQGRKDPTTGRVTPLPFGLPGNHPLVADTPPYTESPSPLILVGNSPNHGGRGQNVLYAGGHVEFRRNRLRSPSDADIYMNEQNRIAPGLNEADAVLSPAVFRFSN